MRGPAGVKAWQQELKAGHDWLCFSEVGPWTHFGLACSGCGPPSWSTFPEGCGRSRSACPCVLVPSPSSASLAPWPVPGAASVSPPSHAGVPSLLPVAGYQEFLRQRKVYLQDRRSQQ